MSQQNSQQVVLHNEKFDALRNAHYHMARQAWFDVLNKVSNFLVIVSGAAIVYQLSQNSDSMGLFVALLTTVLGALQLVFDFGRQASNHELLRKRYLNVARDIENISLATNKHGAKFRSIMVEISADEPPTYRALDAIAFNQIVDAQYGKDGAAERIKITLWQSLTRHICRHANEDFTKPNVTKD